MKEFPFFGSAYTFMIPFINLDSQAEWKTLHVDHNQLVSSDFLKINEFDRSEVSLRLYMVSFH